MKRNIVICLVLLTSFLFIASGCTTGKAVDVGGQSTTDDSSCQQELKSCIKEKDDSTRELSDMLRRCQDQLNRMN